MSLRVHFVPCCRRILLHVHLMKMFIGAAITIYNESFKEHGPLGFVLFNLDFFSIPANFYCFLISFYFGFSFKV